MLPYLLRFFRYDIKYMQSVRLKLCFPVGLPFAYLRLFYINNRVIISGYFFLFKIAYPFEFCKISKIYEVLNLIYDYYCDRHLTFVNNIIKTKNKTKSKCKCKLFTYVIGVHLNNDAKADKTIVIAIRIYCENKKKWKSPGACNIHNICNVFKFYETFESKDYK